ncbi:hypothetical protein FHX28_003877 [Clostridium beijerinckii]|nr:hypothetical protein [Clostridium beijerinckii]
MKILYFTATGNSLYIAKSLGSDYYSIPKLIKEDKYDLKMKKLGLYFQFIIAEFLK